MTEHNHEYTCRNAYQPHQARIIKTLPQIPNHLLYQIRFENEDLIRDFTYRPGQFVMLSVLGTGEAPPLENTLTREPDLYDQLLWQIHMLDLPAETRKIAELIVPVNDDGLVCLPFGNIGCCLNNLLNRLKYAPVHGAIEKTACEHHDDQCRGQVNIAVAPPFQIENRPHSVV